MACALLGFAAQATAAAPPPIEASPAITTRMHWIACSMLSGRIVATSEVSVPRMLVQSSGRRQQKRESLSMEISGGVCQMQYDYVAADDRLQLVLSAGSQLLLNRTRPAERYLLKFQQRTERPLVLTIEQGDSKQTWEADGFWQLYLAEPQLVREHLVPLLELLHPAWQLAATGAQIEEALFQTEPIRPREPQVRQQWAELVASLASSKFSQRENAERELHRAGQSVVPYLKGLDESQLDAEQVARIRAVIAALSVDYEDRVDRVAAWLADDERVWLTLLGRDDPARRRIAADRLAMLLGEPVEFDADAAPETRQSQLDNLRQRLDAIRPIKRPAD